MVGRRETKGDQGWETVIASCRGRRSLYLRSYKWHYYIETYPACWFAKLCNAVGYLNCTVKALSANLLGRINVYKKAMLANFKDAITKHPLDG